MDTVDCGSTCFASPVEEEKTYEAPPGALASKGARFDHSRPTYDAAIRVSLAPSSLYLPCQPTPALARWIVKSKASQRAEPGGPRAHHDRARRGTTAAVRPVRRPQTRPGTA